MRRTEKAREMAKSVVGRLLLEEQTTFGGVTRQFSTLMICPELLTHVKEETEREASLAKNLRKAQEEREVARRKGGKQSRTGQHSEDRQRYIFPLPHVQHTLPPLGLFSRKSRQRIGGG